jgi:RimJ/RimL family protein N-acetyltransferase
LYPISLLLIIADMGDIPVGPQVQFTPLKPRISLQLFGKHVDIIPLSLHHAPDLYAAISGPERAYLWTYVTSGPFFSVESFTAYIESRLSPHTYGVILKSTNKIVGTVSSDPNFQDGVLTCGEVILSPEIQGSPASTEIWLLMFGAIFEYGFRRIEWRCNTLNTPSRKAGLRLGFKYEGTFRQHMVVKGRNRDTEWYSMLDREWEGCKAAMEKWMSPENFDGEGRQVRGLRAIREEMLAVEGWREREMARNGQPTGLAATLSHLVLLKQSYLVGLGVVAVIAASLFQMYRT